MKNKYVNIYLRPEIKYDGIAEQIRPINNWQHTKRKTIEESMFTHLKSAVSNFGNLRDPLKILTGVKSVTNVHVISKVSHTS